MHIGEVTLEYVTQYLRIDDVNDTETKEIESLMESALQYITAYTGLTEEELDKHEDITVAYLVLIQDMFDNRNLYLDNRLNKSNQLIENILAMHSINYL